VCASTRAAARKPSPLLAPVARGVFVIKYRNCIAKSSHKPLLNKEVQICKIAFVRPRLSTSIPTTYLTTSKTLHSLQKKTIPLKTKTPPTYRGTRPANFTVRRDALPQILGVGDKGGTGVGTGGRTYRHANLYVGKGVEHCSVLKKNIFSDNTRRVGTQAKHEVPDNTAATTDQEKPEGKHGRSETKTSTHNAN
jgi:hypothetical protein